LEGVVLAWEFQAWEFQEQAGVIQELDYWMQGYLNYQQKSDTCRGDDDDVYACDGGVCDGDDPRSGVSYVSYDLVAYPGLLLHEPEVYATSLSSWPAHVFSDVVALVLLLRSA
jgi:hypothetical protein